VSGETAEDLVEAELERLARAELLAREETQRHLTALIEAATEVKEALTVDTSFTTISSSVLIMNRSLSEALREVTKYDAWGLARRNLVRTKLRLEKLRAKQGEETT
jgi:hypothetical protein